MIAFDTDVLTAILLGHESYTNRAAIIPIQEQAIPIIVIEEILRGRLNIIRQAEAGKSKISLDRAYELFQETFSDTRRFQILPYTSSGIPHFTNGVGTGFMFPHMIYVSLPYV